MDIFLLWCHLFNLIFLRNKLEHNHTYIGRFPSTRDYYDYVLYIRLVEKVTFSYAIPSNFLREKRKKKNFLKKIECVALLRYWRYIFISQCILINSQTSLPELHAPHCPGWLSLQTKDRYC